MSEQSRNRSVNMRVTQREKQAIQLAAYLSHQTVADFCRQAALEMVKHLSVGGLLDAGHRAPDRHSKEFCYDIKANRCPWCQDDGDSFDYVDQPAGLCDAHRRDWNYGRRP